MLSEIAGVAEGQADAHGDEPPDQPAPTGILGQAWWAVVE